MTIKSDKWIRKMAQEHGMIEPFEAGQVRYRDGGKVISYGTSSYGYDVRCATEFKIFTNVHTTSVVDPKNFDESSFVAIDEPYCIIPPNSFALARTIVAQMLFYQSDEQCEVTYKQRGGKYMGQTGVTPPRA